MNISNSDLNLNHLIQLSTVKPVQVITSVKRQSTSGHRPISQYRSKIDNNKKSLIKRQFRFEMIVNNEVLEILK